MSIEVRRNAGTRLFYRPPDNQAREGANKGIKSRRDAELYRSVLQTVEVDRKMYATLVNDIVLSLLSYPAAKYKVRQGFKALKICSHHTSRILS
jgi:hypothetical protein